MRVHCLSEITLEGQSTGILHYDLAELVESNIITNLVKNYP